MRSVPLLPRICMGRTPEPGYKLDDWASYLPVPTLGIEEKSNPFEVLISTFECPCLLRLLVGLHDLLDLLNLSLTRSGFSKTISKGRACLICFVLFGLLDLLDLRLTCLRFLYLLSNGRACLVLLRLLEVVCHICFILV